MQPHQACEDGRQEECAAWCAGKPVSTRACGDISAAYLYATSPHMFSGATETAFNRVRDEVRGLKAVSPATLS